MKFSIEKSLEILERTPSVLKSLLSGLSENWTHHNEGEGTWSPYDVVGHLIHGEKTDWIPRMEIILSDKEDKTFVPFDRFAQMQIDTHISLQDLLNTFEALRQECISKLKQTIITESTLNEKGIHPDLGQVTLSELLSTWTVHDLGHIAQISRVMAKQYKENVGPWRAYLTILK